MRKQRKIYVIIIRTCPVSNSRLPHCATHSRTDAPFYTSPILEEEIFITGYPGMKVRNSFRATVSQLLKKMGDECSLPSGRLRRCFGL